MQGDVDVAEEAKMMAMSRSADVQEEVQEVQTMLREQQQALVVFSPLQYKFAVGTTFLTTVH